jgi:hypothetical protein
MTAAPMTDVTSIEHLDFAVLCRVSKINQPDRPCGNTAAFYVEVHRIGDCKHPICNDFGNMCGNICQDHHELFLDMARHTVDSVTGPGPLGIPCVGQCGTCGMPVRQVSDIIQKVVAL